MSQTQAKGQIAMGKEITLIKNNDNREISDLAWIEEFFNFLKGEEIEKISFCRGHKPKLNDKKAFAIIYYVQEHFPVFPDHIELCWNCGGLFDISCSGLYWESKSRHYCDVCEHLVPENYDRGKR